VGRFHESNEILTEIFNRKSVVSTKLLSHSRLMQLVVYLAIEVHPNTILDAAKAFSVFLHRKKEPSGYLNVVVFWIKKIASKKARSKEQIKLITEAIEAIKTAYLADSQGGSINVKYHKALALILESFR
jgi:hypothetical protein